MDAGFAPPMAAFLSSAAPNPEAPVATSGAGAQASRDTHQHPRLTSATVQSLDGSGEAVIVFTRSFTAMPAMACLLIEATEAQPVVFKVKSWTQNAGIYTGCTIKGYRASILPALSGILLVGPLISALAAFNVFGGSAAGAQFCCIALMPSN